MNMRDLDVSKMMDFKYMTGRPVNFKIIINKWHKVISDRKLGAFGEIFVTGYFFAKIGDLTPVDLKLLGYSSVDEYLAEPFNVGATKDTVKKFIMWNEFRPNMDVVRQILAK